jgi:hypothetical protein
MKLFERIDNLNLKGCKNPLGLFCPVCKEKGILNELDNTDQGVWCDQCKDYINDN